MFNIIKKSYNMVKVMKTCNTTKNINNRFDLILFTAKRARQMQIIDKTMMSNNKNKHKCTVLALKEVEDSISAAKNLFICTK